MADWIPFVSQAKSLIQFINGNSKGAKQTQINFSKRCPIVSQVRSLVEVITVGPKAAEETQKEFLKVTVSGVLNSTPVVGHIKGVVHYIAGDKQGGDDAMKAASRTVGTIVGGIGGLFLGGPPAAFVGGVAGGAAIDTVITMADSIVHDEFKPNGLLQEIVDIHDDPKDLGKWFDTVVTCLGDGVAGYMVGEGVAKGKTAVVLRKFEGQKQQIIDLVGKEEANDLIEAADRLKKIHEKFEVPENKPHVTAVVRDLDTGSLHEGHNEQVRKYCSSTKTQLDTGNADVMSDYSVEKNERTHLEQLFPNVEQKLKRRPRACAEHRAYHKLYKKKKHIDPNRTRVSTVARFRGVIQAVKRCPNCQAYKKGMGKAPGDLIDKRTVPTNPGFGNETALTQTVKALGNVFVSAMPHLKAVSYSAERRCEHSTCSVKGKGKTIFSVKGKGKTIFYVKGKGKTTKNAIYNLIVRDAYQLGSTYMMLDRVCF